MISSSNLFLDYASSSVDTIALTPEQIEQAAQLSFSLPELDQQWQSYLNHLALSGFQEWLNQRDPALILDQSLLFSTLNTICQLKIGEFKLCLLTQGTLDDEIITIARTALESPKDIAHFYVLVSVDEEQEQIVIEGLIRYDQLQQYQRSGNLIVQPDETYEISLAWFDQDINHLLLYLRCLEPSAIQLPNIVAPEETQPISPLMSMINVGLWLQGKLDEFCEGLSWTLLPTPELATVSFRNLPTFDIILEELQQRGMSIPNTARGASQNISINDYSLQLYALAWLMEEQTEWSLLLILGTSKSNQTLPEGLKLQISDGTGILGEQEVTANSEQSYLYTRVIGELDEQFITTIALNKNNTLTLPPFTLYSEHTS
ncbi:hypothetical protein C7H19_16455 [Aphanothece hegewaldii CCALA 016]|uniref:DUF1822 domain-containing protein n=1 Tax=Aphanothece hegewaldii CCALA 016 TaxID=2107694 RepID=A0A2T1LV85_9CHRO|nr:DUF1822 family protein [Aphanothece hegewaldii]PSF35595.1 hypothetical protein C7H19_16455 [Aphanothece hegewaldii CCALA 016]